MLLRGDMDALPVTERTGVPYASQVPGVMHACGHDLHTAMLAGAARLLSARRAELPGTVIFMFQPGEEGFGGAAADDRGGRAGRRRGPPGGGLRAARGLGACCRWGCGPAGPAR